MSHWFREDDHRRGPDGRFRLSARGAPPASVARLRAQADGAAIPRGWERYVEHERAQGDETDTAHLWLAREVVARYREYERSGPNLEALDVAIGEVGIRVPLWIKTDGHRALLVEGNHRLALAERHRWEELPIRVTMHPRVEGPVLEMVLGVWVDSQPAERWVRD